MGPDADGRNSARRLPEVRIKRQGSPTLNLGLPCSMCRVSQMPLPADEGPRRLLRKREDPLAAGGDRG